MLGDGHYSEVLAAGHRMLEVTTAGPDFRAGPFIVPYLRGPDNERDYRDLVHVAAAGSGHRTLGVTRAVVDMAGGVIDASM